MSILHYVLVTGATGMVGSHVVDNLLRKGFKVRAVVRSKAKVAKMQETHKRFIDQLDFYHIDDLSTPGVFNNALADIEGVIHLASPLNYDAVDKEKELIIPAIRGVQALLEACKGSGVRRVVMTSSFGAVLDMGREEAMPYTYSSRDWNPITYAEAADPAASPQDAYRGSKVFAEQAAWAFVKTQRPLFDLVTFCPSMIFGPVVGGFATPGELNESNKLLWKVANAGSPASPDPLPPARFNFWIDVRDLAEVHVQALLSDKAGGKRYMPVAPEKFNYQIVSEIIRRDVPEWPSERVCVGNQLLKTHINADCGDMDADFPLVKYHSLRETIVDFMDQAVLTNA